MTDIRDEVAAALRDTFHGEGNHAPEVCTHAECAGLLLAALAARGLTVVPVREGDAIDQIIEAARHVTSTAWPVACLPELVEAIDTYDVRLTRQPEGQ